MTAAGRVCPLRYRYGAAAIANAEPTGAATLYVVGGLYGNRAALDALAALVAAEPGPVRICFNGDFHWFDARADDFAAVDRWVAGHDATLGNVEAELLADEASAGCGCAYPEDVDDATVARSNRIHARLKQTARGDDDAIAHLARLPMVRRYRIAEIDIGVVHGDADSLAGWRFGLPAIDVADTHEWRHNAFQLAGVRVFASSHTCLPVLRCFGAGRGRIAVINNGAAGMPNFSDRREGLVSRLSSSPPPLPSLYGTRIGALYLDALPLRYDHDRWLSQFLRCWPAGSAAHESYYRRILRGPAHEPSLAATRHG
ncbi:MAG: hypothetical protein KDG52_09270 [Rhodocyclaceae bacterium]|nr:hypothetical protein [Rhodocyclaceae bacterium]